MSKRVPFTPAVTRWMVLRIPLMTTRSPGATFPVRSSVTSTSMVWGCSPPRSPSGDSWIRSFWESMNRERDGTISIRAFFSQLGQNSGSWNFP